MSQEPEPFKVIDRRGQPKPERKLTGDPGLLTDCHRTGNPREFVAIFPFNRVREHYFVANRIEDEGFECAIAPPKEPTPKQRKAMQAAQQKIRQVIRQAREFHQQKQNLASPAVAQEPEGVQ